MARYEDRMADYVDVAERIAQFKEKFPDGSLQPLDPVSPFTTVTISDKTFVVYAAAAYRTPDDPRPGVGVAWEPFPGATPYTRDSEVMNAETSAWGRAIVAVGIPTKKVASANEVANRAYTSEAEDVPFTTKPIRKPKGSQSRKAGAPNAFTAAREAAEEAYVNAVPLEVPPDAEIEDLLLLAETRGVPARQVRFWLKSRTQTAVHDYLMTLPDKAGED